MSQGSGNGHGTGSSFTERFVGAVTRRRGQEQLPAATADQKLLDHAYGKDWKHEDPWRVLRIQAEFVEGFDALAELGPAVSVFGSARTPAGLARVPGRRADRPRCWPTAGFAVITGGGPGAMEAANKGAIEAGGRSVGLGIELPFEQGLEPLRRPSASTSATSSSARRCS